MCWIWWCMGAAGHVLSMASATLAALVISRTSWTLMMSAPFVMAITFAAALPSILFCGVASRIAPMKDFLDTPTRVGRLFNSALICFRFCNAIMLCSAFLANPMPGSMMILVASIPLLIA